MNTKELIEWLDSKALCEDFVIVREIIKRLEELEGLKEDYVYEMTNAVKK